MATNMHLRDRGSACAQSDKRLFTLYAAKRPAVKNMVAAASK